MATGTPARVSRHTQRLRPGRHPVGLQPRQRLRRRAAPSRSSTPTTTRPPKPTSASTASQYGLPPARPPTAASARSTRPAAPSYPRTNAGWATEISLDLDMVSAACPDCKILLVEASSASFSEPRRGRELRRHAGRVPRSATATAAATRAQTSAYNHPGIAITASTGDAGYGVESPASYRHVVAVGGTSLTKASNTRGWSESAWSGAGSGCSTLERQALVADRRPRVLRQGKRRRLRRRRPEHRRRGLRLARLPGLPRLAGLRRHQRVVADHRQRLHAWAAT